MKGYELVNWDDSDEKHRVNSVKECVYCGLRKGNCNTISYFPILVYFRDCIVLSTETLPYGCEGKEYKEVKEDLFLTKEDFYV